MYFVVLCSSHGTIFQAVIDRLKDKSLTATCLGLVTDSEKHDCFAKATKAGLPIKVVPMNKGESREDFDKRVHQAILELGQTRNLPAHRSLGEGGKPETRNLVIACMGWMWMLSPWFVSQWKNRILNAHPALLPKYPGTHAHDLVIAAKDTESGMTIHLIDEGMDTGKILLQKTCPVLPNDTAATLKPRVQALECEWYPKVLEMIEKGEMKLP